VGVNIGATWQTWLKDCVRALSASATSGGDAACSQITLGNLVVIGPCLVCICVIYGKRNVQ